MAFKRNSISGDQTLEERKREALEHYRRLLLATAAEWNNFVYEAIEHYNGNPYLEEVVPDNVSVTGKMANIEIKIYYPA